MGKTLLHMVGDRNRGTDAIDSADTDAGRGITKFGRRDVLAAGGALAGASLAGCLGTTGGSAESDSTTTDTTMPSVTYRHNFRRVAMSVGINDAAEELGLWEEEGLDVDFKTSTGARKAAKSVASGEDEFANGDYATIVKMINAGRPLQIIGHIHYPMDGVVAKGDWLDGFSDLEGKVVGQYDRNKPRLKEAIRRDGGDPSKVTWQTVNPGAATKLLINDKVDASAAYWPPNYVRLRNRGIEVSALNTADKLDYMGLALYGHEDVVENQPEVVNSFVRGVIKAHRLAGNDIGKIEDVYREKIEEFNKEQEYDGFGYHLASRVPSQEVGKSEGFGWLDEDRLRQTLNLYTDIGILDEAKSLNTYLDMGWFEQNQDLAVEAAEAIYERLDEDYPFGPEILN
jgi:NitT/TauT family transport system substrate-binding protein